MSDQVNHPKHYGGEDSPYEVIKIAEHYNLDLYIFNLLKYSLRAGIKSKETELQDLEKGLWYLQRKINRLKQKDLTINIKCEDNLSPVLEEMHEKVLDIKKDLSGDQLAIEKFMDINKQERKDQFKPLINPEKPKKISELKVGDEIKAIDPCTMHDHGVIELMGDALIVGNNYKIKNIYNEKLDIRSEVYDLHTFDFYDLHEYFHVIK